jgi:hypothetical protein
VSTWLAADVPPTEVAERAGHTVDVLLKVCAKVMDGQRETSNQKITELLGKIDADDADQKSSDDAEREPACIDSRRARPSQAIMWARRVWLIRSNCASDAAFP